MKVLDLFSGIGGFSLGLERAGMETVAFCEMDPFCRQVLARHWPHIPIYTDIRRLTKEDVANDTTDDIGVICGGYPCQPYSVAGPRRGELDHRHLWPEMYRLIKGIRPQWVIAENVAGHVNMGLDDVLHDLENANYQCWTFIIPAIAVGGLHRRNRLWIVAHADGMRQPQQKRVIEDIGGRVGDSRAVVANADGERSNGDKGIHKKTQKPLFSGDRDDGRLKGKTESRLGRRLDGLSGWLDGFNYIADPDAAGIPRTTGYPKGHKSTERPIGHKYRTKRLKALGNAVVPQIPEMIARAIVAGGQTCNQ